VSLYDAARIEKTKHFTISPLKQGRGPRQAHVVGFDTEAIRGQPVMLQISEAGGADAAEVIVLADRPNACLDALMTWITEHCQARNQEHIVVGFNLMYEWTQLFGDLPPEVTGDPEFNLLWAGEQGHQWHMNVWNHKRHALTMVDETSQRRVRMIDAAAFFPGGLKAVAKMVGVEDKDEIDKERFTTLTRADLSDPVFRHYAAQDAVVTRLIGERIVEMHEEFDLPTCMTAPQFASRVFRRHFLGSTLALAEPALEQAGLLSYHGGKNGFYLHRPTELKAWNLDIVSAYPQAMRALPALETGWWHQTSTYQPGAHALWHVRMRHHPCRFIGALTHGGQHLPSGWQTLWLTGYELDAMVEREEARQWTVLDGWVLEGDNEGGGLTAYVDRFFEMKRNATGASRLTAKLLLNSLYGKFFQKQPLGNVDNSLTCSMDSLTGDIQWWTPRHNEGQDYDYRAGGLYHPPIASLITGYVRGRVHRLEHAYAAVATSTDGLFARNPPWVGDLGDGLGKLTAEHGTLSIWRERLYDFSPLGPIDKHKVALHGFRGNPDALREIPLRPGVYTYDARHAVTLRESQQVLRGERYRPGAFAALSFTLDLTA
jgi:hypothetical protein